MSSPYKGAFGFCTLHLSSQAIRYLCDITAISVDIKAVSVQYLSAWYPCYINVVSCKTKLLRMKFEWVVVVVVALVQLDQGQELEDMVRYLELEQQFSTKKTKLCEYSVRLDNYRIKRLGHLLLYNTIQYNAIQLLLLYLDFEISTSCFSWHIRRQKERSSHHHRQESLQYLWVLRRDI